MINYIKNTKCYIGQSLKIKFMLVVASIIFLLISGIIFANVVILPHYYQGSKIYTLSNTFDKVNELTQEEDLKEVAGTNEEDIEQTFPDLSDETILEFEKMETNKSIYMYVFDVSSFWTYLKINYAYPKTQNMNESERENVKEKVMDYVLADLGAKEGENILDDREIIKSSSDFNVYKVYDNRIGSNYMELFGKLKSGRFIYLRTNYQSMNEAVNISNKLLGYIGVIGIVLGMILMYFVSNEFINPVKKLTKIATKMAELDFDTKYPVKTDDEIGKLGNSINTLSKNLEEIISELKSANNELHKDIEKKIQVDEMRKDFLSNVSHELKTPIALIQGYAEGLIDNVNDDPEEVKFYCEVIQDEAMKMNNMVKKLLTLNQIEFGSDLVQFERFDIVQVVNSVANSAELLASKKGATIEIENHEPVNVWADEYLIEEIITNYVSNAINHVDYEKKIKISFEDKSDIFRVNVYNSGDPIPEEDLEKIWIKFYKVDKARTREYGGSGIGLSIVKAIMESLNRECGAYNVENGVVFWFELDKKSDL